MKYTILGFSQEKLIKMNLDTTDTHILRWFVDFFCTGKMDHIIDEEKIFSWVRYNAVIKDLPILGITSTRVIARHFKKLANAGLMEEKLVKNTSGTYSYFHLICPVYNTLLSGYSINPKDIEEKKESNDCPENIPPVLESTGDQINGQILSCTVLKSDLRSVPKSTISTVPESTTKASIYHKNSNTKIIAAAANLNEIENYCRNISEELVFPKVFFEKAAFFMSEQGVEITYFEWLYQYITKSKKYRDIRSLFMRLFFEEDILMLFVNQTKKHAEKSEKMICPVCSVEHDILMENCPNCDLTRFDRNNQNHIQFEIWYRSLTDKSRESYDEECRQAFSIFAKNGFNIVVEKERINKKYGYTLP